MQETPQEKKSVSLLVNKGKDANGNIVWEKELFYPLQAQALLTRKAHNFKTVDNSTAETSAVITPVKTPKNVASNTGNSTTV